MKFKVYLTYELTINAKERSDIRNIVNQMSPLFFDPRKDLDDKTAELKSKIKGMKDENGNDY